MNGLLNLFVVIIAFGLGLWLIDSFIPMPSSIRHLLKVLVVIVLIVFILQFFGLIHTLIPLPVILK